MNWTELAAGQRDRERKNRDRGIERQREGWGPGQSDGERKQGPGSRTAMEKEALRQQGRKRRKKGQKKDGE